MILINLPVSEHDPYEYVAIHPKLQQNVPIVTVEICDFNDIVCQNNFRF